MLYLFLADGFEEVEAIATIDVIRRAGLEIKTVGVSGDIIRGAHDIYIKSDSTTVDFSDIDGVILPGGMPGTTNLKKDQLVNKTIDYCYENGKLISAICAAPSIIGALDMLNGKRAVCFPGFEDELTGAKLESGGVVRDGNIITAKGAGVSLEFAAEIVDYFNDSPNSKGREILDSMQCKKSNA